jgi:hypothetical protein
MADRNDLSDRHAATLRQLADELKVPVAMFLGELPDSDANNALALMRFWLAIQDSQGRQRVLSVARQEAERGGYESRA